MQPVPRNYLNTRKTRYWDNRKNTSLPPARGMIDAINFSGTQGKSIVSLKRLNETPGNSLTSRVHLFFQSFKTRYIQNPSDLNISQSTAFGFNHSIMFGVFPYPQFTLPGTLNVLQTSFVAEIKSHCVSFNDNLSITGKFRLTSLNQTRFRNSQIAQHFFQTPWVNIYTGPSRIAEFFNLTPTQGAYLSQESNHFYRPIRLEKDILFDIGLLRTTAVNNAYGFSNNIAHNLFSYNLSQSKTFSEMKITERHDIFYFKELKTPNISFSSGGITAAPLPLTNPLGAKSTAHSIRRNFSINLQWTSKPVEVIYDRKLTKTEDVLISNWVNRESRERSGLYVSPNVFHPFLTQPRP